MMQETKRVKNPGKQRKRLFNAPAHIRHKLMAAPLSSELTASRGAKTLPVRKGDTVRIQRGDNKGFEGKVSRVDPKNFRVYLEGLTREKVDGTNIFISVHPSKIQIRNLNLDDKRRKEVLGRKKEIEKPGQEKAKVKPTKKVEKAQAKIAEIEEEKPVEPEVAKTTKEEEELVEKVPEEIAEKTSDEADTEEEAPVAKKAIAKKPAAKKPFAKKDEAPEEKKKLAEEEAPAKKTVKTKAPAKKTAPKSSTKSKVSKEGGQ
jgi:large subunit ribosomal protein L24